MAGIFKNLDASDIRLTPFRAYKQFEGVNSYTTYSAVLNTKVIDGLEDIGNNPFYTNEFVEFTTNSQSANTVWHSIDNMFYRHYYHNPKAAFGSIIPTYQPRYLSDEALVISIPQSNFGEQIEPTSFQMVVDGRTYVDDLYGNVYDSQRWDTGYEISASNILFALKPSTHTRFFSKKITETILPGADLYQAKVELENCLVTASAYETTFFLDNSEKSATTASITIVPNGSEVSQLFNFQNKDYGITLTYYGNNNCVLLEKTQEVEVIKVDINGNTYTQVVTRYPYRLYYNGSNKVVFSKSDGANTLQYTSTFSYTPGNPLHLIRSGSTFRLINGSGTGETFTDTLYDQERYCVNSANIHVGLGSDRMFVSGAEGAFGNIYFYKEAPSYQALAKLANTTTGGRNNPYQTVGNVLRHHGLIVITDKGLVSNIESNGITSLKYRGTTTIFENEISCTVGPGEFGMTFNPTAHQYDPKRDQYRPADFVTGSAFRPYITRIGLYDDLHRLVAIGSLSQPVQLPKNVDTTFIVKYDY